MLFEWDKANREHIAEHDVTTDEAEQAFENDPVDLEVQDDDDDGFRYKQIGETNAGRILIFISANRGDFVRIATAFDAPKAFKDIYFRVKARQSWNKP
jgi:uncharacterized DUF497 family protein